MLWLWHGGGTPQSLGTLGGTNSYGFGINNIGQVVGESDTSSGAEHAFLYSGGAMRDLNKLISNTSGWTLEAAFGINDNAQIVGVGINSSGQTDGFLLTPNGLWLTNGSGDWSGTANWANGYVPGAPQDVAIFGTALTGGTATVTFSGSRSLSSLSFSTNGGASYVISPSARAD